MMLAEVEEIITEEKEMPSFNHSYICKEVLWQLFENKIFHNQEVESEGIKVDFKQIFG